MRLYLVSLLGVAACAIPKAQAPITDGPDATIGCYLLEHGSWSSNEFFDGSDSMAARFPPPAIQLLAAGNASPGIRLLGRGFPALEGRWRLVRRDSLVVRWTDGTSGIELRFGQGADGVVGTGRAWASHKPGIEPTTPVKLIKEGC
jgi:hypothetical protein